jgi:RNA polymerase sigma-70 factor (ECF subfamily)
VYAMIYQMVRNEQDAWDLAQDAFIKAWKAMPRFKGESTFYTWLYRIVTNVTLDKLRKKKTAMEVELQEDRSLDPQEEAESPQSTLDGPDRQLARREVARRIEQALGELGPDHQAVIVLRELQGLSYEEIARTVGCSLGTVMSRLFYARKKLQATLRDVYENL